MSGGGPPTIWVMCMGGPCCGGGAPMKPPPRLGSMTSPVTESRVPPRGSLGPSPSRPLGGIPPGPKGGIHQSAIDMSGTHHLSQNTTSLTTP